jgi:thioredoxin reductase (NADPH)
VSPEVQLSLVDGPAIETDAVIVGAGPVGLFQVFELGLLGLKAHVVDSLHDVGGQCIELYPDKPIYDIPAVPACTARELIERLEEQIRPFDPVFHLGQEVTEVSRREDGRFLVATSRGTHFNAGALVIAGGVGSFQPRRLTATNAERFEGRFVHYRVRDPAAFAEQDLLILGGGDSALDWTLNLAPRARSVVLVHRRPEFRAAPATVARMFALRDAGQLDYLEGQVQEVLESEGRLAGASIRCTDGVTRRVSAHQLLAFFGLHPKLGPIAEWGLDLNRRSVRVDTEKFQTSVPGIFAVGDINDYPGKKKLILSGFHETALAAFAIAAHLRPGEKQHLQYTTTSPLMHRRLGVSATEQAVTGPGQRPRRSATG